MVIGPGRDSTGLSLKHYPTAEEAVSGSAEIRYFIRGMQMFAVQDWSRVSCNAAKLYSCEPNQPVAVESLLVSIPGPFFLLRYLRLWSFPSTVLPGLVLLVVRLFSLVV